MAVLPLFRVPHRLPGAVPEQKPAREESEVRPSGLWAERRGQGWGQVLRRKQPNRDPKQLPQVQRHRGPLPCQGLTPSTRTLTWRWGHSPGAAGPETGVLKGVPMGSGKAPGLGTDQLPGLSANSRAWKALRTGTDGHRGVVGHSTHHLRQSLCHPVWPQGGAHSTGHPKSNLEAPPPRPQGNQPQILLFSTARD